MISPRVLFYTVLFNLSLFFLSFEKKYESDIKIPGFRQNFQKYKKQLKKEKNIFVHTTKCLKAKKSYCVFHTPKNNVLACILTLTKISKTIKKIILFVF